MSQLTGLLALLLVVLPVGPLRASESTPVARTVAKTDCVMRRAARGAGNMEMKSRLCRGSGGRAASIRDGRKKERAGRSLIEGLAQKAVVIC